MTVYRPENIINRYVWEQFKTQAPAFYSLYPQTAGGNDLIPFFPAGVGNIPPEIIDGDLPYIVFDKFTKVRTGMYKYFYPMKSEQMRYTIYGGSLYGDSPNGSDRYGTTITLTSLITAILDREDVAAEDINEFAEDLYDDYPVSASPSVNPSIYDYSKYFFHCINVFQSGYAESQQDVANLMEYRPSRDLIIKYDYHSRQYNTKIPSS
jgi:hypothetical protein